MTDVRRDGLLGRVAAALGDEALADQTCTAKSITVTGSVERVRRKGSGYVLVLKGPAALAFEFASKARGDLAKLKPGQFVTVSGRCQGTQGDGGPVIFSGGQLLQTESRGCPEHRDPSRCARRSSLLRQEVRGVFELLDVRQVFVQAPRQPRRRSRRVPSRRRVELPGLSWSASDGGGALGVILG